MAAETHQGAWGFGWGAWGSDWGAWGFGWGAMGCVWPRVQQPGEVQHCWKLLLRLHALSTALSSP